MSFLGLGEPKAAGRRPIESLRLPECSNGYGEEAVAEGWAGLSVVQHDAYGDRILLTRQFERIAPIHLDCHTFDASGFAAC